MLSVQNQKETNFIAIKRAIALIQVWPNLVISKCFYRYGWVFFSEANFDLQETIKDLGFFISSLGLCVLELCSQQLLSSRGLIIVFKLRIFLFNFQLKQGLPSLVQNIKLKGNLNKVHGRQGIVSFQLIGLFIQLKHPGTMG